MDDEGPSANKNTLLKEWNLFWKSITSENEKMSAEFDEISELESLSPERIKELTLELSRNRKQLNQKLEELKKKMEAESERLGTLQLVGGETQEALENLESLGRLGEDLTEALQRVDSRIKILREHDIL